MIAQADGDGVHSSPPVGYAVCRVRRLRPDEHAAEPGEKAPTCTGPPPPFAGVEFPPTSRPHDLRPAAIRRRHGRLRPVPGGRGARRASGETGPAPGPAIRGRADPMSSRRSGIVPRSRSLPSLTAILRAASGSSAASAARISASIAARSHPYHAEPARIRHGPRVEKLSPPPGKSTMAHSRIPICQIASRVVSAVLRNIVNALARRTYRSKIDQLA